MMTSRDRVQEALDHRQADQVPLDLGASDVTGMHVDSVYRLRQALQLDPPALVPGMDLKHPKGIRAVDE